MLGARFIPVVLKQVWRHRTRSLLTALGVATAMFLFCSVQALQRGVTDATSAKRSETTLVVYRENRFCPFTSRLPEHYAGRIARVPGVADVVPIKIVVNNCRAGLDVVTFRGVPEAAIGPVLRRAQLLSGSTDAWTQRSDAAIVGEILAGRRRLKPGDRVSVAGVTVTVAGVIRSPDAQDQNAAYVHLPFLQQAAATAQLGVVTQFNVRVSDPDRIEQVAEAIDAEFRSDPDPTRTRPETAFIAQAAGDIVEIVGFTRYLGWASLAAVLALVGNAIVLGVQDRVKEHAVLQTLGYRGGLIARLIIAEGLVLSLAGGALGSLAAWAVLRAGAFSLTTEGISINVRPEPLVIAAGLAISATLGVVAGLIPALQAGRREIAASFRAV